MGERTGRIQKLAATSRRIERPCTFDLLWRPREFKLGRVLSLLPNAAVANPSVIQLSDINASLRRIAKSKIRLKHRSSLIFTKRKNMEYNFVVNLGVPAHFVKKTDFAIRLMPPFNKLTIHTPFTKIASSDHKPAKSQVKITCAV